MHGGGLFSLNLKDMHGSLVRPILEVYVQLLENEWVNCYKEGDRVFRERERVFAKDENITYVNTGVEYWQLFIW